MSDFSILDGLGRGNTAEVDNNFRVRVHGTSVPLLANISQVKGTVFMARTSQVLDSHTITATGGHLIAMTNIHPSLVLVLVGIVGRPTANDMFVEAVLDVTVGTVGNATEIFPVNLNVGSPNISSAFMQVYVWDEVGDGMTGITGGQALGPTRLFQNQPYVAAINSAAVLPPGKAVSFMAKGAGEFSVEAIVYMVEPDDLG